MPTGSLNPFEFRASSISRPDVHGTCGKVGKMKTNMLTKARKLFASPDVPAYVNRHNRRAWVRSIRHLVREGKYRAAEMVPKVAR